MHLYTLFEINFVVYDKSYVYIVYKYVLSINIYATFILLNMCVCVCLCISIFYRIIKKKSLLKYVLVIQFNDQVILV